MDVASPNSVVMVTEGGSFDWWVTGSMDLTCWPREASQV